MYEHVYDRLNAARISYDKGVELGWYVVGGAVALMFIMLAVYYNGPLFWRAITVTTISIAIVFLVIGIFTPMLEVEAFVEDVNVSVAITFVEVEHTWYGKAYAFYQNKSIMDVVGVLWSNNKYFIAFAILAFSVLVPIIKLSASLMVVFSRGLRENKKLNWVIQKIGKWSMADVFVAAIFLAMLAFNSMQTGIELETASLMGIYFFLAYCILSLLSSSFLKKAMVEIDGPKEEA